MIQITLKAKHFYYIANYLRNASIEQYYSLIFRMKDSLKGNTDNELSFSVDATPDEVVAIYRILTALPEGQASSFNAEMGALLQTQITNGAVQEGMNGIGPDADGNLPMNAYWQRIAVGIQDIQANNLVARNNSITIGKSLIDS